MFKIGDRIQILPEFQDEGDDKFERTIVEVLDDDRVLVATNIPSMNIIPSEVIETRMIKLYESN